jgi:subtilisin family serine protease
MLDLYQDHASLPHIKVAIIDTGIDSMHQALSGNIIRGASFVPSGEGRSYPWFTASDPHGTYMASLILQVNPLCDLYIYRISAGSVKTSPITHESVVEVSWPLFSPNYPGARTRAELTSKSSDSETQAIEAAIADDVDIINASWSFDKDHQELRTAVRKATTEAFFSTTTTSPRAPVLVFAAKSDEMFAGAVYPADYDNTISVGAATSRGRVGSESNKNADLIVLGEDMPAFGPAYYAASDSEGQYSERKKQRVTGSSVATALATGIASLLLMVAKNRDERTWERFKSRARMLDLFMKMRPAVDSSLRFVDPQQLFMAIKTIADGEGEREKLSDYLVKRSEGEESPFF